MKAVINTAGFLAAATQDQDDFFNGKYGLTQSGTGGGAVFVPYPDLITDLRLIKACEKD